MTARRRATESAAIVHGQRNGHDDGATISARPASALGAEPQQVMLLIVAPSLAAPAAAKVLGRAKHAADCQRRKNEKRQRVQENDACVIKVRHLTFSADPCVGILLRTWLVLLPSHFPAKVIGSSSLPA